MYKYEFTGGTKEVMGVTVGRIRATRDFGFVNAGDLGGWIEHEDNLSHNGDCWVAEEAIVCGNAFVFDRGCVCGNARVCDDVRVFDNASVCGNAVVLDSVVVRGNAVVYGNAVVRGDAIIRYDQMIYE